jgi:hypothetical protein
MQGSRSDARRESRRAVGAHRDISSFMLSPNGDSSACTTPTVPTRPFKSHVGLGSTAGEIRE